MVHIFDFKKWKAEIVQLGEGRAVKSCKGVWLSPSMTLSDQQEKSLSLSWV